MNQAELLDQFIVEAREVLEKIGQRLLDVEREPANAEWLNDLFRHVHTLKGNCGLFEFKALERVVHAGEDLLDRVRNQTLAYSGPIADALLEAMDYALELVDAIEAEGRTPAAAEERSQVLARRLRAHLPGAGAPTPAPAATGAALAPAAPGLAPDWVPVPAAGSWGAGCVALRYRPEPECFFKGEDPWNLVRTAPGLRQLVVAAAEPWPAGADFDCYRCNLDLRLLSDAPLAVLQEHFRYVPEQTEWWRPGAAGASSAIAPPAALQQRAQQLWATQCELLARVPAPQGVLAAVACTFEHLLSAGAAGTAPQREALARLRAAPLQAAPLLDWARSVFGDGPAPLPAAPELPAPAADASRGEEPAGAERGSRVVKVGQEKIDQLMDLIGEMVVAKNALPYLANRAEEVFGQRELAREIKAQYAVINRIAEDMQRAIMQVRMLPVGTVLQRFGRLVRDISRKLGKEVQLVVEGEATEADKNVIESLADPLMHIVRNSLDHGLETPARRLAAGKPALGTLRIAARQEGDRVLIEIGDDGAGIDTDRVRAKAVERGLVAPDRAVALTEADAVQLVFLPGFSTAETISDLSGRGVGMDVVRKAVERVGGTVVLNSRRGAGTTIRLSLPLSMAVSHVMEVASAGRRFGVPMEMIVETVRVAAADIHFFKRARTAVLRGRVVPLCPLNDLLGLDEPPQLNAEGEHAVLVVRPGGENVGLIVDQFHGTTDIILKPLEGVLAGLTGFAGTALMGDGSVLMVLNPKELL
jgi:two-component system chemotaxis sensor kinase CheA